MGELTRSGWYQPMTAELYRRYLLERDAFATRWARELLQGNHLLNKSLRMWNESIQEYERAHPAAHHTA